MFEKNPMKINSTIIILVSFQIHRVVYFFQVDIIFLYEGENKLHKQGVPKLF